MSSHTYTAEKKKKVAYAPEVTFMKLVIFSPITALLVSVMHFTMEDYCFASQFIMLLIVLYLIYNICLAQVNLAEGN